MGTVQILLRDEVLRAARRAAEHKLGVFAFVTVYLFAR